jgi:hypothetical protein
MTKLTVKNAHNLDLDTLGEEDLRKLAANLIRSRQDRKTAEQEKQEFLAAQVKKQGKIHSIMMPQIATLLETLAERAGLSDQPSVRSAIDAVGEQAYTQWSGDVENLPDLVIDPEVSADPSAGNAEMVLCAKIDESIQVLQSALDFGKIDGHIARAVRSLIDGIDEHMTQAIANGFKELGSEWKPIAHDKGRDDLEISLQELSTLLSDLSMNVDFGTQVLRLDLRAGMYRELTKGLHQAGYIAHQLAFQEADKRTPAEIHSDILDF